MQCLPPPKPASIGQCPNLSIGQCPNRVSLDGAHTCFHWPLLYVVSIGCFEVCRYWKRFAELCLYYLMFMLSYWIISLVVL